MLTPSVFASLCLHPRYLFWLLHSPSDFTLLPVPSLMCVSEVCVDICMQVSRQQFRGRSGFLSKNHRMDAKVTTVKPLEAKPD